MYTAIRWLEVLFGKGDSDYPFWLLTVRVNILLVVLCAAVVTGWNLSPVRLRKAWGDKAEICTALAVTVVAGWLRFAMARANVMDHGGIAYSRLLLGYKGYFGTAQFFSLFYGFTARDIEHAILFDRIAGVLTIPLVYVLCRSLRPEDKLLAPIAAFLFAVYPLHILFSASDVLAVFSVFLAAASYALLAAAVRLKADSPVAAVHYFGGCAGLALLTQVRYENILLLVPPAVILVARRDAVRFRQLVPGLAVLGALLSIYGCDAATAGLSYENPLNVWHGLDIVTRQLVLNPFLAVPVLFIGTVAVWAYKGSRLGSLALLPWLAALGLAVLTSDSGHSAARTYANWLILILPCASYGFSLALAAPQRLAKAVAGAALLYLGAQPIIVRECLGAQYLEVLEHARFKSLLADPPSGAKWIIVPDDQVMARHPHSTFEAFTKYAMTLAGEPEAAQRVKLVALTEYLEGRWQSGCTGGACVFFFGVPCMEENVYPVTRGQCQDLLRTHRTSLIEDTTVVAAPFADCSIFTGVLREKLCAAATNPRRFAVYRIEE